MKLNPPHYLAIDMLVTGESNKAIAEKLKEFKIQALTT